LLANGAPGIAGKTAGSVNPYNGETLAEIALAGTADLDEAYAAAAAAQTEWARSGPSRKIELFHRVISIMDDRQEEIINWIVRETGGTLLKAGAEWAAVRGGLIEALTLPSRVEGRIMPIDNPGKQSFVYREPIGVVGVISPWNFPMHLSHRSIAPALATGNAVAMEESGEDRSADRLIEVGIGRFNGDWIVAELTRDHWITVQEIGIEYPF
jgi:aldehyde dehydrogenase (NAD+)